MENYYELPELIPENIIERVSKLSSANICDGLNKLGLLANRCMCQQIKPVSDNMKVVEPLVL